MITEAASDDITARTAIAAITYWPAQPLDDPEYSLSGEAAGILEGIDGLTDNERRVLETLIISTIVDPTGHRENLYAYLAGATDNAED
jgi:hypothetical protein